jgi:two-component system, LytTR family, sensor kinase
MRKGRQILLVTAVGCLIATVLGFCWATHTRILGDEGKPVLWSLALAEYMSFWWGWGLMSGTAAYLVQRFPIAPQRKRNALVHLASAAVASPLHSLFGYASAAIVAHNAVHHAAAGNLKLSLTQCLLYFYPRGMVYYFLIVAITHALIYYRQFEERSRAASLLESQLAQAKLHLLKMQLHPHFLFNTLNSISALLHEDVEQADLMIERLGDFLRLTLEHSTAQEVTLREELEFLNCYLSIEQIRLEDRLSTRIDVDPETLDARVPSLILQPIVENAIRHGIAPRSVPGRLEIEARQCQSALVLTVRDNGPGLAAGANGTNGKGMGLKITRHRLERLYGTQHRLELVNAPEGGLVVTLEIPFAASMALQGEG